VDLAIHANEIVCLIGSSGSGKSTLLRILAGLAAPQSGVVHQPEMPESSGVLRGSVVFQSPSLLPWLSVRDNIGFGLNFKSHPKVFRKNRKARIDQVLDRVGLQGHASKKPSALSGGMAQRTALARALVREPEIIFLDEPFSALDAITRESMQDLLVDLVRQSGRSALLVTHDIDEALRIGDRVLLLATSEPQSSARILGEWRPDGTAPRQHRSAALNQLREEILFALSSPQAPWHPSL
jgi:NitT/TauT family transport system ATP-binding protein